MGTGPRIEDSGKDAGRFKGEEQHGWAPDVGTEGNPEGREAADKAFEGESKETSEERRS
jgi:hypothetical protein